MVLAGGGEITGSAKGSGTMAAGPWAVRGRLACWASWTCWACWACRCGLCSVQYSRDCAETDSDSKDSERLSHPLTLSLDPHASPTLLSPFHVQLSPYWMLAPAPLSHHGCHPRATLDRPPSHKVQFQLSLRLRFPPQRHRPLVHSPLPPYPCSACCHRPPLQTRRFPWRS